MKTILLTIVISLIAPTAFGNNISKGVSKPSRFDHWSIKDGLSSDSIYAIAQDSYGYLWIGTENGLNRFDGTTFRHYGVKSTGGFLHNKNITSLHIDHQGILWVGTRDGLSSLNTHNYKTQNFYHDPKVATSISSNKIRSITEDASGHIWIGTFKGLNKYDTKTGQFHRYLPSENTLTNQSNSWVTDLVIWQDEVIILNISGEGLFKFNIATEQFERFSDQYNSEAFWSLYLDNNSQLWATTDPNKVRVYSLDGELIKQIKLTDASAVMDVYEAKSENIWVTTLGSGIFVISPTGTIVEHIKPEKNLDMTVKTNNFTVLYESKTNEVWAGSATGIYKLDPVASKLGQIKPNFSQNDQVTWSIESENSSHLWVGGSKKIKKLEQDYPFRNIQSYDVPGVVFSLEVSNDGTIYAGGTMGFYGLNKGDKAFKQLIEVPPKNGRSFWVFDLLTVSSKIFLATTHGFFEFNENDNSLINIEKSENDGSSIIDYAMTTDNKDKLWFTSKRGVIKELTVSNNTISEIINLETILNKEIRVHTLEYDGNDRVYIGTQGDGIFIKNIKTDDVTFLNKESGIAGEIIFDIKIDNSNILVSTDKGLYWYSLLKNEMLSVFTSKDGLQGNEFHPRAGIQTSDSCTFFGGKNGVTKICLDEFRTLISNEDIFNNHLHFDQLYLNYEKVPSAISQETFTNAKNRTTPITLDPIHKQFSISFTNIGFNDNSRLKYYLRLNGFNKKWVEVDSSLKTISYTSLPPGLYSLEIMTKDSAFPNRAKTESVWIRILPPWWQTPIAYLAFFLITIAGFSAFYLARTFQIRRRNVDLKIEVENQTKKLQKSKLELEEIAKEKSILLDQKNEMLSLISHEMKTPLTVIKGSIDQLKSRKLVSKDKNTLQNLMEDNTERLFDYVKNILSISKIKEYSKIDLISLPLSDLVEKTALNLKTLASFYGHKLLIDIEDNITIEGSKSELELMVSNLIKNSIFHSGKNCKIEVKLFLINNESVFHICDNGIGISKDILINLANNQKVDAIGRNDYASSGLGLRLIKEVVELHKGKINIDPGLESGTKIEINLPNSSYSSEMQENLDNFSSHKEFPTKESRNLKPSILVVDDEKDIHNLLDLYLQNEFNLSFSSDGIDALNRIKDEIPDLILVDIVMPNLDGIRLIQTLKIKESTRYIPIIVVSADVRDEIKVKSLIHGIDVFVEKPFNCQILKTQIRTLLKKHQEFLRQKNQLDFNNGQESDNRNEIGFSSQLRSLLEENFENCNFGTKEICNHFNISDRTLQKRVLNEEDMSPRQFIYFYRCEKAKQLLSSGESIEDIAESCGFTSAKQLRRWFNEHYGCNPTNLAKAIS